MQCNNGMTRRGRWIEIHHAAKCIHVFGRNSFRPCYRLSMHGSSYIYIIYLGDRRYNNAGKAITIHESIHRSLIDQRDRPESLLLHQQEPPALDRGRHQQAGDRSIEWPPCNMHAMELVAATLSKCPAAATSSGQCTRSRPLFHHGLHQNQDTSALLIARHGAPKKQAPFPS